ncbi:MAG: DUF3892 domain-containing protein [Bacillota bacterium]|nr:DUF3892 domain-containing protein [Bacillota bacterium]
MLKQKVIVIRENSQGENQRFKDVNTELEMSKQEFIQKIEMGEYPDYHVQKWEGKNFLRSNPDRNPDNNLK